MAQQIASESIKAISDADGSLTMAQTVNDDFATDELMKNTKAKISDMQSMTVDRVIRAADFFIDSLKDSSCRKAFILLGGPDFLFPVMKKWKDYPFCQGQLIGCVVNLLCEVGRESTQCAMEIFCWKINKKGMALLVGAMRRNPRDQAINFNTMCVMINFCQKSLTGVEFQNKCAEQFANLGGVPLVCSAMEVFSEKNCMQLRGTATLGLLCRRGLKALPVMEAQALGQVSKAIQNFPDDHNLYQQAVSFFLSLVHAGDGEQTAEELIVASLQSEDSGRVSLVAGSMRRQLRSDNRKQIPELGVQEALFIALKKWQHHEETCGHLWSATAAWSAAWCHRNSNSLGTNMEVERCTEVIDLAVEKLEDSPNGDPIQITGINILVTVGNIFLLVESKVRDKLTEHFVKDHDGLSLVCTLMKAFPTDLQIQQTGSWILRVMRKKGMEEKPALMKNDVLPLVALAVQNFPEDEDLKEHAAAINEAVNGIEGEVAIKGVE